MRPSARPFVPQGRSVPLSTAPTPSSAPSTSPTKSGAVSVSARAASASPPATAAAAEPAAGVAATRATASLAASALKSSGLKATAAEWKPKFGASRSRASSGVEASPVSRGGRGDGPRAELPGSAGAPAAAAAATAPGPAQAAAPSQPAAGPPRKPVTYTVEQLRTFALRFRALPDGLAACHTVDKRSLRHTISNPFRVTVVEGREAVVRKARGLLNKLTRDKFDRLSDQLLHVGIEDQALLTAITDLLLEKAMSEPFYDMYADLSEMLAHSELPEWQGDSDRASIFHTTLRERAEAAYLGAPEHEAWRSLQEEDRELKYVKWRLNKLGLLRFLGELLGRGLLDTELPELILNSVFVEKPLRTEEQATEAEAQRKRQQKEHAEKDASAAPDADADRADAGFCAALGIPYAEVGRASETVDDFDVEQAVALLEHAGPHLEAGDGTAGEAAGRAIERLREVAAGEHGYSLRVRFMAEDLLEMRTRGWQPKGGKEQAMTIAEVHEQAEKEAASRAPGKKGPRPANKPRGRPNGGGAAVAPGGRGRGRNGGRDAAPARGGRRGDTDGRRRRQGGAGGGDGEQGGGWTTSGGAGRGPAQRRGGNRDARPSAAAAGPNASAPRAAAAAAPGGRLSKLEGPSKITPSATTFAVFSSSEDDDDEDVDEEDDKEAQEEQPEAEEEDDAEESAAAAEEPSVAAVQDPAKVIGDLVEDVVEIGNVAECVSALEAQLAPEHVRTFLYRLLVKMSGVRSTRVASVLRTTATLLRQLATAGVLSVAEAVQVIVEHADSLDELRCDAPKLFVHIGTIFAMLTEAEEDAPAAAGLDDTVPAFRALSHRTKDFVQGLLELRPPVEEGRARLALVKEVVMPAVEGDCPWDRVVEHLERRELAEYL